MAYAWIQIGGGRQRLVNTSATAEGTRDNARSSPYVRPEHLSPKERRGLRLQLGRDFDSRSQLEAYMKDNDFRFVDRGDRQDRARTRMKDWMGNSGPGERGRPPFQAKDSRRGRI